jgi:hypothetical protein
MNSMNFFQQPLSSLILFNHKNYDIIMSVFILIKIALRGKCYIFSTRVPIPDYCTFLTIKNYVSGNDVLPVYRDDVAHATGVAPYSIIPYTGVVHPSSPQYRQRQYGRRERKIGRRWLSCVSRVIRLGGPLPLYSTQYTYTHTHTHTTTDRRVTYGCGGYRKAGRFFYVLPTHPEL